MSHQNYFAMAAARREAERKQKLSNLSLPAYSILEYIGIEETNGRVMNVTDIVHDAEIGTPPTVYKYLNELEEVGWICFRANPDDHRQKLVSLTARAKSAFSRIASAVL
ncbi:MAG: MarR family winged helix-turn-helix transcriptional regulator [bacterium]|jgi:DNA-binding MarR family transcriptional regulator